MDGSLGPSVQKFRGTAIAVIGDVMLDRFIYGRVSRISQEAPIPVLHYDREAAMPGGAGNVARNIAALGGVARLVGAIGADDAGRSLAALLENETNIADALVHIAALRTTEKIRYVTQQQQVLRVDKEERTPIAWSALQERALSQLAGAAAVILSDYAKGVISPELAKTVIAAARAAGIPVIVDPKGTDYARYDGATLLTPSRQDAALVTGIAGDDDEATAAAANAILAALPDTQSVIVTRGERGMTIARRGAPIVHLPARARDVFDVSGAGDTVVAALSLSLAAGLDLVDAAALANRAAGIVVGKRGTATVGHEELERALQADAMLAVDDKIVSLHAAAALVEQWRANGLKVGFTNGCFDLVHPGHVSLLAQARAACDRLVVGLNADASVKRLKGAGRPVQNEVARAVVLASLASTDLIVTFEEDTPIDLITALRPDVLIKGKDYTLETLVGADFVRSYGGSIVFADLAPGHSTTGTIARMTRA